MALPGTSSSSAPVMHSTTSKTGSLVHSPCLRFPAPLPLHVANHICQTFLTPPAFPHWSPCDVDPDPPDPPGSNHTQDVLSCSLATRPPQSPILPVLGFILLMTRVSTAPLSSRLISPLDDPPHSPLYPDSDFSCYAPICSRLS